MRLSPLALLLLVALIPPRPGEAVGLGVLAGAVAVAVSAIAWKKNQNADTPAAAAIYIPPPNSLTNKTIVITGATSGLGLESAKRLAAAGANLILTARSDAKGQAAVDAVHEYLRLHHDVFDDKTRSDERQHHQKITYKLLDLDKLSSVKKAAHWGDVERIHVLINNAGIMALPKRELTEDGLERQIQSNHLGHFLLTAILSKKFTNDCRIINVSSDAYKIARWTSSSSSNHSLLDFDYLWKAEKGYGGWKSYGQSKLANILFTQELQRRIDKNNNLAWKAVALHPGAVVTELGRHMRLGAARPWLQKWMQSLAQHNILLRTVERGASTQIWLAAAEGGDIIGGKYYHDCKAQQLSEWVTTNATIIAERLWKESEELSGVSFTI